MDNYDIFISYSRVDAKEVDSVVSYLESEGFFVWIDRNGDYNGENLSTVLVSAIENSNVVLYFSSRNSNSSEWAAKEIGVASNRKKKIIPIKLDDSNYNKAIEMHLVLLDYVDLTDKSKRSVMLEGLSRSLSKDRDVRVDSNSLKIKSNQDCKVYIDGDEQAEIAKANKLVKYSLKSGQYDLECISCSTGELWNQSVEIAGKDILCKPVFQEIDQGSSDGPQTKPLVNIGLLGHHGHGKTNLATAILTILEKRGLANFKSFDQINNAPELEIHGAVFKLTHVDFETKTRQYCLFDCPNHTDYVKSLLTGATHLDGAVVVVSAVDGPMQQTCEQIQLAQKVNIPRLVVFINRCNLVKDINSLENVEMKMRELLDQYGFDYDSPVIYGSAQSARNGILEWRERVLELLYACDSWFTKGLDPLAKPFLMPIENVTSIAGHGTLATGHIETGVVSVGDEIQIQGFEENQTSVVTSIEMYHKKQHKSKAGDKVSLQFSVNDEMEIMRGMVISHPGAITSYRKFKAVVYILNKKEGGRTIAIGNSYRPQFYFRSMDCPGEISLPEKVEKITPGDFAEIQVELDEAVPLNVGLRFFFKEGGRNVGSGTITELL